MLASIITHQSIIYRQSLIVDFDLRTPTARVSVASFLRRVIVIMVMLLLMLTVLVVVVVLSLIHI